MKKLKNILLAICVTSILVGCASLQSATKKVKLSYNNKVLCVSLDSTYVPNYNAFIQQLLSGKVIEGEYYKLGIQNENGKAKVIIEICDPTNK